MTCAGIAIPARVEGVIASRLAHLPKENARDAQGGQRGGGNSSPRKPSPGVQASDARTLIRQLSGDLQATYQLVEGLEVKRIGQQRLSRYRFSHELFQHYLYSSLDPVELSYMHESIGLALETLYGERAAEIAAQLARHFELAELPDKARLYLRIAGEQAAASYANDAALDFLKPRTGSHTGECRAGPLCSAGQSGAHLRSAGQAHAANATT